MATKLNPYLSFDGNAREAIEFYQSVLGGELTLSTFGEFGMEGPQAAQVMHAQLETPSGYTIMASDTPPDWKYSPGTNISMSLSGGSAEADELKGFFEKLSEGATVTMPIERQMWGDDFGMLTDKFGIAWLVNIAGEQNEQS